MYKTFFFFIDFTEYETQTFLTPFKQNMPVKNMFLHKILDSILILNIYNITHEMRALHYIIYLKLLQCPQINRRKKI